MIFQRAKAMFPRMKNYCFTMSSDDIKWKENLLEAANVMNRERLTGYERPLTPAKYYDEIRNNFLGKGGKLNNKLITDFCHVKNTTKQVANPNCRVRPLMEDDKGNTSKPISRSEANSNNEHNENAASMLIELSASISPPGINTIQVPSNNSSQMPCSQFSCIEERTNIIQQTDVVKDNASSNSDCNNLNILTPMSMTDESLSSNQYAGKESNNTIQEYESEDDNENSKFLYHKATKVQNVVNDSSSTSNNMLSPTDLVSTQCEEASKHAATLITNSQSSNEECSPTQRNNADNDKNLQNKVVDILKVLKDLDWVDFVKAYYKERLYVLENGWNFKLEGSKLAQVRRYYWFPLRNRLRRIEMKLISKIGVDKFCKLSLQEIYKELLVSAEELTLVRNDKKRDLELNTNAQKEFKKIIGKRNIGHKNQGIISAVVTNDESSNCELICAPPEARKRKQRSDIGTTRKKAKVTNHNTANLALITGTTYEKPIDMSNETDANVYVNDNLLSDGVTESDYNLLQKVMEYHNLNIVKVPPDGHCCPYAIAMSYFNRKELFNCTETLHLSKIKWSFSNAVKLGLTRDVMKRRPKYDQWRLSCVGEIVPKAQYMVIEDVEVLAKLLNRQILVMSTEIRNKSYHVLCGTIYMPKDGDLYACKQNFIVFDENNKYDMRIVPHEDKKKGNKNAEGIPFDPTEFISSQRGIIICHSGLHFDSVVSNNVEKFSLHWPNLIIYNPLCRTIKCQSTKSIFASERIKNPRNCVICEKEVNGKEYGNYFSNNMDNTCQKSTELVCENCVHELLSAFMDVYSTNNANVDAVTKFASSFNISDLIGNVAFNNNLRIALNSGNAAKEI